MRKSGGKTAIARKPLITSSIANKGRETDREGGGERESTTWNKLGEKNGSGRSFSPNSLTVTTL